MDENELQSISENITGMKVHTFTIAKDELVHLPVMRKPALINCNTGNSYTSGEHWLWFYVYNINHNTVAEYYDSYGETCEFYNITLPYKIVKSNEKQHQHDKSNLCGQYCLYMTWHRVHNIPYATVINSFGLNYLENDRKVNSFYSRLVSRVNRPPVERDKKNQSPSCLQMCQVIKIYQQCRCTY